MRLIDSDALRRRLIKQRDASAAKQNYGWEWEYNGWNGAILQIGCEMIEHPVDAEPVIRCKDCKYNPKQMLVGCPLAGSQLRDDNWYCAWGEKKND